MLPKIRAVDGIEKQDILIQLSKWGILNDDNFK